MDANVTDLLSGDHDGGHGTKQHSNGLSASHSQPQHEESHFKKWDNDNNNRHNGTDLAVATQAP